MRSARPSSGPRPRSSALSSAATASATRAASGKPSVVATSTTRLPSDQQHFSALGSAGGAEPCGDAQADLKRPLSPSGEVGGRSVVQNRRQKPVYPRKEAQTSRAESSPRSYRGRPPTLLSERNHLAVHAGLDLGSAVAEQGARASLASAGPGYPAVCSPSDLDQAMRLGHPAREFLIRRERSGRILALEPRS
jgi:hypothetical protein